MLLSQLSYSQPDTANYFPAKVGTTWFYRLYPQYSNERERLKITRDSISLVDSSHYLFINGESQPRYRIDTSLNVYAYPFASNFLIFKQRARKLETWVMTDTLRNTSQSRGVARIKEIGYDILFGAVVEYKQLEWGSVLGSDTSFGLSPRSEFYARGFGIYFVIVEPSATERYLEGFISGNDTLGIVTNVPDLSNAKMSFRLYQNFPNPFNFSTNISYELDKPQKISLILYDVLGREIKRFVINEEKSAGRYTFNFDAQSLASGIFFLRLFSDGLTQSIKMLYLK